MESEQAAAPLDPALDRGLVGRGEEPDRVEYIDLDFRATDGTVAGFVRLTVLANQRACWFWTVLRTPQHSHVAVIEPDLPMPSRSLEFRTSGLWVDLVCEDPFTHYAVGLEAFGLLLDEPGDAVGHRVPVGYDLEWESVPGTGYPLDCVTHGEILVADEVIELDGHGSRTHRWSSQFDIVDPRRPPVDATDPHAAVPIAGRGVYRRQLGGPGEDVVD